MAEVGQLPSPAANKRPYTSLAACGAIRTKIIPRFWVTPAQGAATFVSLSKKQKAIYLLKETE